MAKYSKTAQKSVASAMRKMKKGMLTSGQSGKKVTNPKQAVAIGLSEAKAKGAKVPAAPKKATKKTATKKAAPKKVARKAGPKKAVAKKAAGKKTAAKKAPVKKTAKKAAPKKTTAPKAAPKKAVKKTATKTARKTVPKKTAKKAVTKKAAPQKTTQQQATTDNLIVKQPLEVPKPPVAIPVDTLLADQHHEHTVDPNDIPVSDFSKFTVKADPRQNMKVSSKPKGGIKPGGKKPLWN